MVEDYRRIGRRSPKWDADVENALTTWSKQLAAPKAQQRTAAARQMLKVIERAEAAGCDDPMFRYFATRYRLSMGLPSGRSHEQLVEAGSALLASQYSPYRKMIGCLRAAGALLGTIRDDEPAPSNGLAARQWLERCLPLIPLVLEEPDWREQDLYGDLETWCELYRQANAAVGVSDPFAVVNVLVPILRSQAPHDALSYTIEGNAMIKAAWAARGGGWASTVSDEGWRLFRQRLTRAEDALTRAYELDPRSPCPSARHMITVCMGRSYDRDVLETWFRRAMISNPNDLQACKNKMLCLEPKWGGEPKAMLEFAQQCLRSGKWEAEFHTMLARCVQALSADDGLRDLPSRPGVQKKLATIELEYLRRFPDDLEARTEFLLHCCERQDWPAAWEQFKIIGDEPWPGFFFPNEYKAYRQLAEASKGN